MKIQIGNNMDDFSNIPINHQLQFTTTDAAVVIPTNPEKEMRNKIIGIVYGHNNGTIIFENELTRIPDSFLLGCSNLKSISLPPSVRSIGSHAFFMCQNLERIKQGSKDDGNSRVMFIVIPYSTDIDVKAVCYTHFQEHTP